MKKQAAFGILLSILLANIVVFMLPFVFVFGGNLPVNSVDPLRVKLLLGGLMLLVLNVSILLTFLIYRKMVKKPKPLMIFLLTLGIFVVETYLLFRNMIQFDAPQTWNNFGLPSYTTSLLFFVVANITIAYVIVRYKRGKFEAGK